MSNSTDPAKDATFVERVWRLTGERNEDNDLYHGAELVVNKDGDQPRVFVKNSGRELPNVQMDKTTPYHNFNYFKILEIRQIGNVIDSIKVLASKENPHQEKSAINEATYWLVGGTAFLTSLLGILFYRWRKS